MSAVRAMNVPEGGLASFLTSNLDEIEDRVIAFGRKAGLNSFGDVANRMAGFGRNGDDHMIHAKTGELIVAPEILEENPELAKKLAEGFANSNVDMNRYYVGNENNSINPITGQPEFFLKKIVEGVKSFVKGAVNVVKKIAPVVLPFAINMIAPGLGSIASGALGAGLGSLIQGKSLQDSFKAALLGGAMGGLSAGIKGALTPGVGFMKGIQQFGMPVAFGGGIGQPIIGKEAIGLGGQQAPAAVQQAPVSGVNATNVPVPDATAATTQTGSLGQTISSGFGKAKDFLMPDPAKLQTANYNAALSALPKDVASAMTNADKIALFEKSAPSFLQKYGKLALAGTGVAAAAGAFNPPEAEPLNVGGYDETDTAENRLQQNPELYSVGVPTAQPTYVSYQDILVPSQPIYSNYIQPQQNIPPMQMPTLAARGGEMSSMFPRRNGYISGPGTETSDDVPAMLSDGEFVMTARAVRGLGGGDRETGVKKMYEIMRAFEGGVVS